MVKLNRIYTRTGDDGSTGLVGGKRVSKTARRVTAYGDVDELNAHMGRAWTLAVSCGRTKLTEKLRVIQNELFDLGAELATPPDSGWTNPAPISTDQVSRLERWIDELNDGIPELKSFVLPGGTELNAELHIARTVCRRAERETLALAQEEPVSDPIKAYINRLSDLLFVMSRYDCREAGVAENLWEPGSSRKSE